MEKSQKLVISDYLRNYDKIKKKGECKKCLKNVGWSTKDLKSHKRANCVDPEFNLTIASIASKHIQLSQSLYDTNVSIPTVHDNDIGKLDKLWTTHSFDIHSCT